MGRPRIYTSEKMRQPYQLELIGQGVENLVYEAKGYPGVVLKGSKVILAETLAWNASHGLSPETDSPYIQELREGRLAEARAAYQNLRTFFGNHVLPQKQLLMEVPFNTSVLRELKKVAKTHDYQIPTEGKGVGWTIVTIQKKTEVLNDWRLLSLRKDPYLTDLLHRASKDAGLAKVLADFQRRAVQHAKSTQDILDVIGKDNIVFHQTDTGSWSYTLIDAIHPFVKPRALEKTRLALAGQNRGEAIPADMRDTFIDTLNYVAIINILGKEFETNMRIDLDTEG